VRVCRGCKYAEDGSLFEFELFTNEGNTRREAVGRIVQEQLAALGIVVNFRTADFWTLVANMQTYDAYIYGWVNGFPDDPDQMWLFGPGSDFPSDQGSINASSYYSPEFDRLSEKARTLPGCDRAGRATLYHQIERLLQEDQPYLWLYATNELYAAHTDVVGFDPQPNMPWWNIHTWQVSGP